MILYLPRLEHHETDRHKSMDVHEVAFESSFLFNVRCFLRILGPCSNELTHGELFSKLRISMAKGSTREIGFAAPRHRAISLPRVGL